MLFMKSWQGMNPDWVLSSFSFSAQELMTDNQQIKGFILKPPSTQVTFKECMYLAAAAKSLQSCPTLCAPIDGSPPGSPVPGILQVRTLKWVAISFSNARKGKVKVKSLCVQLLATPWTAAYQAPPSMGFPRQEYWSGVPSPSPKYPIIYEFKTDKKLTGWLLWGNLCHECSCIYTGFS